MDHIERSLQTKGLLTCSPQMKLHKSPELEYSLYMYIGEFIWSDDRIDHIARHNVEPYEVEEVCFSRPLIERAKSQGSNPVYYIRGQTRLGRYLFCVIIRFADGNAYTITARDMTQKEQRRYRQWKKR